MVLAVTTQINRREFMVASVVAAGKCPEVFSASAERVDAITAREGADRRSTFGR
jgi:hypothetical protein